MHSDKQPEEEVLFEQAVKLTIQKYYDRRLFEKYDKADEMLKDYLLNERRKPE